MTMLHFFVLLDVQIDNFVTYLIDFVATSSKMFGFWGVQKLFSI